MPAETIVVDALSVHMGGGSSYLTQQLRGLHAIAPERSLVVLTARWNHDHLSRALDTDAVETTRVRLTGLATRVAYEQLLLPRRNDAGAVLYCPGNIVPLRACRLPTVLALQNPNMVGRGPFEPHNRRWRRRIQVDLTRRSLRRADQVVVISESLRDEVLDDGLVEKERLHVVPSGGPRPAAERLSVPDGFPFGPLEYFLVLANDAPHKRHDVVIQGWARAAAAAPEAPALVIAGRMTAARRAAQRAMVPPSVRSQLVHLGPVDDRGQISWLLGNARALVAMSRLEAHPLTPAEAGLTGCPLVLSDIPAHREVAGPFATFVPVDDVAALAATLRMAGVSEQRVPWEWPISWNDNARRLLDVFDELVP